MISPFLFDTSGADHVTRMVVSPSRFMTTFSGALDGTGKHIIQLIDFVKLYKHQTSKVALLMYTYFEISNTTGVASIDLSWSLNNEQA